MTQPTPPTNTRILLATSNKAKQETLRWLLEGLPLEMVTLEELGLTSVPDEPGETHEEIARLKAQTWSEVGSMLVIASDGGLVIPALGDNWESRFTHRFAGPATDDEGRLKRLMEIMQPYQGQQREASWVEAVAVADSGNVLASWELPGSTGIIADEPGLQHYTPGFWVFSVWYFPQLGKLYNELTSEEKESLDDHWTRLKERVQQFFKARLST